MKRRKAHGKDDPITSLPPCDFVCALIAWYGALSQLLSLGDQCLPLTPGADPLIVALIALRDLEGAPQFN